MRARMNRRRNVRRLSVITIVVVVIAIFVVAFYIATLPTSLDAFAGKPVSAADMTSLTHASNLNLGPSGQAVIGQFKTTTDPSLSVHGKPVVLYIGADYCPYCAVQRWGLILALMRFGTFSNLAYMTSNADGTDWATFSFHGSTYTSNYLVFAGYEQVDRVGASLDTVPANYSSPFSSHGRSAYPFMDFGGKYYVSGALLPPQPTGTNILADYLAPMLNAKNWTQIFSAVNNGSSTLGSLIRENANAITAAICKINGAAPTAVCQPQSGLILLLKGASPVGSGAVVTTASYRPSGSTFVPLLRRTEL